MEGLVWEDGASDDEPVAHAKIDKTLPILIHNTTTVSPHHSRKIGVVRPNLGIEISDD